ncbi:glycine zipper 2TM domain-containing protein [Dyella silvatica]|uniref:glycine zipper 2TM domain-containing protein n=1 Tax=Dyella silvatica TaxID=2992128 RepID=UPI00225A904E|nr:glycine zipper 2TM domain-containing protein [Dyella silvatica]
MTKLFFPALILALTTVSSAFAQDARYSNVDSNAHYGWADVLRVDPIYGVARTEVPRQECYDQQVVHSDSGSGSTAGTILGAVVGGVLGSTVGRGGGRTAATVAGAVVGGAVGNSATRTGGGEYESTETRCRQVSSVSEQRRIMGYDVEYRYHGEVYVSRLNYDPGERLRVRVSVGPAD